MLHLKQRLPCVFVGMILVSKQFAATVGVFRDRFKISLLWELCLKFILARGDSWMNNGIKNLKICMLIYLNKFDIICITLSLFSSCKLFIGCLKFYWRRALWNTNFHSLLECISRNNVRPVFLNIIYLPSLVRS